MPAARAGPGRGRRRPHHGDADDRTGRAALRAVTDGDGPAGQDHRMHNDLNEIASEQRAIEEFKTQGEGALLFER